MGTETDLLVQLQVGDDAALKALYDLLSNNVYALAWQMLGSREDAEEVLQDTFVKLHHSIDRFDPELSSGKAYVYTIARNEARMRLRALRSRPVKAGDYDLHSPASTFANPHERDHETYVLVKGVLEHLQHEDARLLKASFYEGYSHAELAEQTGLSLGTVKSRIRRALQRLRERLVDA